MNDDSYFRRVWRGASATIDGIKHVWKDQDVRRAYRVILLGLFVLALLLNGAGIYGVLHFTETAEDTSRWLALGLLVLRFVGIFLVLLLSPIAAITTANILFPVFSEIPFFAGFRSLAPERAAALEARDGFGNVAAILNSLRRFGVLLLVIIACFFLGLIPVVGAFLAAGVQFYLSARTLGWEMLDPYFDRIRVEWSEQKKVVKRFGPEILGMGMICAPLLSIPLFGPLLFGLLQASTAQFVIAVLPEGDDAADLIRSSR